jgi:dihydrofolate synthase/folylpolyglutamate synthase
LTPKEALAAIDALEVFGIDLGLDRISACLDALGSPQHQYPSVHVGGTNGKGSTSVLIASALVQAGHQTGLYTSPPLECFGERIRVSGESLPSAAVPELLEAVMRTDVELPQAGSMTQFEVITAMAFLHFARARVDAAVVEVGLGGRLDSTNVILPEVAVVTNVAVEHAEHLGTTPRQVAREKAGIIKPGAPLITAAEGDALEVLREAARATDAPVFVWGRDFVAAPEPGGTYRFEGRRWLLRKLEIGLLGSYQRWNLGVALAALETLEERGWALSEDAVRRGLAQARWPGRMELLGTGPRVVLDGAHNPHASRALAATLTSDFSYGRLCLVLGILGDKDARSILADLVPLADAIILTRSSSARAVDPEDVYRVAERLTNTPLQSAPTVSEALDRALAAVGSEDLVCVTGSLTTVGEARAHLRSLGWVR